MTAVEIPFFRWDGVSWLPCPPSSEQSLFPLPTLKIATFNVLADCFPRLVELAIASPARFAALVTEVERLDADVLGLNEVTEHSLARLLSSDFVRRSYYVTELPGSVNGTIVPHGVVILTKVPPRRCIKIDSQGVLRRSPIVAFFSGFAVCAMHTLAYQTTLNKQRRKAQIREVCQILAPSGPFVVMGDLNLHYRNEDSVVLDNNLVDCWAETHFCPGGDGDAGYTFDAAKNLLIPHYIPGESRRMRLDRILLSDGFPASLITCSIWGDAPVDARRHIQLSDHFGLVAELDLSGTARTSKEVLAILTANASLPCDNVPGVRAKARFVLSLVSHCGWLTLRALGVK